MPPCPQLSTSSTSSTVFRLISFGVTTSGKQSILIGQRKTDARPTPASMAFVRLAVLGLLALCALVLQTSYACSPSACQGCAKSMVWPQLGDTLLLSASCPAGTTAIATNFTVLLNDTSSDFIAFLSSDNDKTYLPSTMVQNTRCFESGYIHVGNTSIIGLYAFCTKSASGCPMIYQLNTICATGPAVNCTVGDWGGFGSCSSSCNGGVQTQTRSVVTQPANGGLPCPTLSMTQACNIQACPVDCVVSDCNLSFTL